MTRGVTVPQPAAVEEEPMPWPPRRDMAPSRTHRESPGTIPRDPDTQPTPTADAPSRPSKSQRKRDAHALQALGAQLVALSPAHLAQLALPAALCAAVVAAQRMRQHGARMRQIQYLGKLMRQLDPAALRRVRAALDPRGTVPPRAQP